MRQRCPAQALPLLLPALSQSPPAGEQALNAESGICLQCIAARGAANYVQSFCPKHRMGVSLKYQVLTPKQSSNQQRVRLDQVMNAGSHHGGAPRQCLEPLHCSLKEPQVTVSTTWQMMTTMTTSLHHTSLAPFLPCRSIIRSTDRGVSSQQNANANCCAWL